MPNYLLSWRGTIEGVDDIFAHTMAVVSDETDQAAVAQAAADAMEDALSTNGGAGLISTIVAYTEATAAEILDLSLGTLAAASHVMYATPIPGAGGNGIPPQVATCISLTAGTRPNGTPLRGRFYLPTPGNASLQADGTFNTTVQGEYLAFATGLVGALSGALVFPHVWSRSLALMQPVGEVRVGNVPDVIRSRRNSGPETYVSSLD